tara:strand:+ start:2113 stop:2892 length:780 start_codon:yes stop_codon:yes gene_type:complete
MTDITESTGVVELATVEVLPPAEYDDLRREVIEARDQTESAYWRLAGALFTVWNESAYEEWGHATFNDYIDQELDMQRRKAQYLVSIAGWFGEQPESVQGWVKQLGWTKARELVGLVDENNSGEWQEKAENSSLRELTKAVKEAKSQSTDSEAEGEVADRPKRKNFALFEEQMGNVNTALAKCMTLANSDKEGHALDLICTEYLSQNSGFNTLNDYLERVQGAIGLKLVALDASAGEVVFGSTTLDEMFPDDDGENSDG